MAEQIVLILVGKIAELLPIKRELDYLFCFNNNFQELQTLLEKLKALKYDVHTMEDAKRSHYAQWWIEYAGEKIEIAESLIKEKAELRCPNISLRYSLGRKGKKLSLILDNLLYGCDGQLLCRILYGCDGQLPDKILSLPIPSIKGIQMAENFALSVGGMIAELLIEPIQRELGYLFCFNNNFHELQTELEKLKTTRTNLQAREDAEMRKLNTLGEIVRLWIENADGIIEETESLIKENAEVRKGCFSIKWCPNIRLHFSLSRKGKKLSLILIELLQSGAQLPHTGHALPMPLINMRDHNGDAGDFDSRNQIMEDVIEKLRDEETMLIGICGMRGIGKTTFAKQVLQKVQDLHKPLFTIQVITTVSSSPNFNAIQEEVAQMLGFSLKDVVGQIARAHYLRKAFSKKNVVVLLDDVWKEFDLNAIGFPLSKSDVGGCFCKIVYTSRIQGLWLGERNITKQEFSLNVLSREEALTLFKRKVDLQHVDSDFNQKNGIAGAIVDECKGLPLALIVAGDALLKKGTHQWDNMLNRLKKHHKHQWDNTINEILKTSYDFLEEQNERVLFILCCLFQEDTNIPVETLYRYATGLNLFKDTSNLKEISAGVHTVVDNLIMKNLLIEVEDGDDEERVVKMHDVVRDVGISIAKQEQNGFNFVECHNVHQQEFVPDRMELPGSKLELLRLDSSRSDFGSNIKISTKLFQGADNLKVVDIIGTFGVTSEFPLFSSLAKLKMLSFEKLNLDMITSLSSIEHIKCLEILCLRSSTIRTLPKEISELTNLRLLDLTGCKCFIINGVFSKLTNLQELYMWNGFNDWRLHNEDVNGRDNHAAGLDELNCLKLWKLELEVPNIEQVPRDVNMLLSSTTLLEQFKIRIGGGKCWYDNKFESGERQLWIENVRDNTTSFLHELGVLIEKGITNLCISNDLGMWEKMHLNNFLSLRRLVLKHCGSIITLFPPSQSSPQMFEIKEINGLGHYLKCIEIYECNQMRYLCSTLKLRHLTNLQSLILEGCEMTEEVVNICDEAEQLKKIELNALELLMLRDLYRLKYFCKGINEIHFHKLKRLELKGLKHFIFPIKLEMPCLEKLDILFISNIETPGNLVVPSLKQLCIDSCDNLRYVFSKSFVTSISHLEDLFIKKCKMLKGVIGMSTDVEEHWKKPIEFSTLKILRLESLDKLTSFVMDINNLDDEEEKSQQRTLFDYDEVSFPSLEELRIEELSKINYIVGWKKRGRQEEGSHRHNRIFSVLSELMLTNLRNLIHIYEIKQAGLEVLLFQKLTVLIVGVCEKLRYLFSENIGRVVGKHLVNLEISDCPMMEVVMKKEEELIIDDHDDDREGGGSHFFPLLMSLQLWDLSGLRRFCDIAYTWALPSLIWLQVTKCPKLKELSPGYLDSSMLDKLYYGNDREKVNVKNNWKGDLNRALRDLSSKKYKGEEEEEVVKRPVRKWKSIIRR